MDGLNRHGENEEEQGGLVLLKVGDKNEGTVATSTKKGETIQFDDGGGERLSQRELSLSAPGRLLRGSYKVGSSVEVNRGEDERWYEGSVVGVDSSSGVNVNCVDGEKKGWVTWEEERRGLLRHSKPRGETGVKRGLTKKNAEQQQAQQQQVLVLFSCNRCE